MKKSIAVLALMALLAGCENSTKYGDCIGIGDEEQHNLHYRVSGLNVVMGVIFSETIVVPAVVLFSDLKCPTGVRNGS
jgi:hypothetical protein